MIIKIILYHTLILYIKLLYKVRAIYDSYSRNHDIYRHMCNYAEYIYIYRYVFIKSLIRTNDFADVQRVTY